MAQTLWKTIWRFFKKNYTELPYDPTFPLLVIHSKELKAGFQRDICAPMFTAALFIIAKMLEQQKCPSTDE